MCTMPGVQIISRTWLKRSGHLKRRNPLFVSVSDIPCIDAEIISTIHDAYRESGKDACSTWIPSKTVTSCRGGMTYRTKIRDIEACPTGLNILRGNRIAETQDELQLVLDDPRLAINVNTRDDRVGRRGISLKTAKITGNPAHAGIKTPELLVNWPQSVSFHQKNGRCWRI